VKSGALVFVVVVGILLCLTPFAASLSSARVHNLGRGFIVRAGGYQPHGDIVITSDQDFVNQGWPGNGTANGPYLISGFEFATALLAINVSNTDTHLLISDCLFTCPAGRHSGMAVQLHDVQNIRIERCIFTSIACGPIVRYSQRCNISECGFDDTDIPVHLYCSNDCALVNNTIKGSIGLYDSDNCTISSNEQHSDPWMDMSSGFNMIWCDDCVLFNNTVIGNLAGLWLDSCLRVTLDCNTMLDNGVFVRGYESQYFDISSSGNTVNGRPLGYFYGEQGLIIDGEEFGQMIIACCQDMSIQGGSFDNSTAGVLVVQSHGSYINNVTSRWNYYGMLIGMSGECTIGNSTVAENTFGIDLSDLPSQARILNNTVCDNVELGIGVSGDGHHIYWNTICRNGRNAIDSGSDNTWDDGVRCGNFWDDMIPGAVYLIPGTAGSVDHYPNGTLGTYTIPPTTTSVPWIGNDTDGVFPFTREAAMIVAAAGVSVTVAMAVIIRARRRP